MSGICGTTAIRRASSRRRSCGSRVAVDRDLAASGGRGPRPRAGASILPAPFGPISATHSPRSTENETPSTTLRLAELDRHLVQPKRGHTEAIRLRGAEHDGEERRAEERGDDADRQLARRERRSGDHVGEHEEAGADEHRERQEQPVARADDEPDRVRDDDPDEPDQPADRDRGRRADGRADDDHEPHAADVHAEARSLLVADAEHVEQPAVQEDPDSRDHGVRQERLHVRPVRARQRAEDPASRPAAACPSAAAGRTSGPR